MNKRLSAQVRRGTYSSCIYLGYFTYPGSEYNNLIGKRYADGTRNVLFKMNITNSNISSINVNKWNITKNVEFDCSLMTAGGSVAFQNGQGAKSCQYDGWLIRTGAPGTGLLSTGSSDNSVLITDLEVDAATMPSPATGILMQSASTNGHEFFLEGVRFKNFPSGSRAFVSGLSINTNTNCFYENVDWGNVSYRNQIAITSGTIKRQLGVNACSSQFGKNEWFILSPQGQVDWVYGLGYPTLNARLLDGVTPWSICATPTTLATNIGPSCPLDVPQIHKINTLGAVQVKATVEVAIHEDLPFTAADITMYVMYENSLGELCVLNSMDVFAGALVTSTAAWSAVEGGKVAFYPGPVLYNRYKLELTTPDTVAANTDVSIGIRIHREVTNNTQNLFIDPEVVLTEAI